MTGQLGKNINNINPDDIISITEKIHGSSGVSSKVLVKRKLSILEKLAKKMGIKVVETHYDNYGIYASRKIIKNSNLNEGNKDYYEDTTDWRKLVHDQIHPLLSDGMTAYYEIVGYTPNGSHIQKKFDYGCKQGELAYYIYRLTYTNQSGQVFEFSAKQVQDWCKLNGVKAVPEIYYGSVYNWIGEYDWETYDLDEGNWREFILEKFKLYWLSQCKICKSKVPNEGIVLRKEDLGLEVYKFKNPDFLYMETKQLDSEETNIEDDENS